MANTKYNETDYATKGVTIKETEKTKYTIINTPKVDQGSDVLQTDKGYKVIRISLPAKRQDEIISTKIVMNVEKEKRQEMYLRLNNKLKGK